jgi:hypothetical protein
LTHAVGRYPMRPSPSLCRQAHRTPLEPWAWDQSMGVLDFAKLGIVSRTDLSPKFERSKNPNEHCRFKEQLGDRFGRRVPTLHVVFSPIKHPLVAASWRNRPPFSTPNRHHRQIEAKPPVLHHRVKEDQLSTPVPPHRRSEDHQSTAFIEVHWARKHAITVSPRQYLLTPDKP